MKVLLTGGLGRLGRYVAKALEDSHEIVLFDAVPGTDARHAVVIGDIRSEDDVTRAIAGCDAVVHLAGIPILTPEHRAIWDINTSGTLNVLECMVASNARRIVFASSICAEGFINSSSPLPLRSVPVDESYDGVPDDIYGLSKTVGELLCQAYVRRHGFTAVSLRFATIRYPEIPQSVARLKRHSEEDGARFLWNYVDARDAAQATKLALESDLDGHHAFHVGADDTCSPISSRELVSRFYPYGNPAFEAGFPATEHEAVWSIREIKRTLGYQPRHTWRAEPQ
ncbi:NAD-dependent epimerase/dehydratase family protein [Propylenella binzhouense]|uniref:NAD(P)-dependent oxidoreductase n=1 Tax=Propylenella binzhouense TaxID=2555902 RepID=A0A964T5V2_9HYPH|nr:NAD(P)-dependent oxidoreductase [Propylenella binzhouense]MYZ48452.1 NAD(P)-dependent oxidoreductase [Propylenella binzhouense]